MNAQWGLPYETDTDACCLAEGCKFETLCISSGVLDKMLIVVKVLFRVPSKELIFYSIFDIFYM